MNTPTLVVVACNRPESLQRLLTSVARLDAPLVVSVDQHERAAKSIEVAGKFGAHVIARQERLGLKEHFLQAGDLAVEYGAIVLLEDDLYVSPFLLDYARAALAQYADVPEIAGVTLYSFGFNEFAETPFAALDDGTDAYLAQSAGWGMLWTSEQWTAFRAWHALRHDVSSSPLLPSEMNRWPEPTWKRLFNLYLAEERKYVVVPRHGLVTNLAEPGVHVSRTVTYLAAPMSWGPRQWLLPPSTRCRYDPFLQLEAESLRAWSSVPLPDDLALDLYAQRDLDAISNAWVLTARQFRNTERTFGIRLFPFELNVIENIAGGDLALVRRSDVLGDVRAEVLETMRSFYIPPWRSSR